MNKSRIEQGLADYVAAVVTAAGKAASIQVLPGKTDEGVSSTKAVIFCIVDRLTCQVGNLWRGTFRFQVQKPGKANEIEDYRVALDVLASAFPVQSASGYAAAVSACSAKIALKQSGAGTNGWHVSDQEDQEDSGKWVDDLVLMAGVLGD